MFGGDLADLAFPVMVALAVGGLAIAIFLPMFSGDRTSSRVKSISADRNQKSQMAGFRARFGEDSKDGRRRQIQDSLKQLEDREKERKKKLTLRTMIGQAGFDFSPKAFWLGSLLIGAGLGIAALIFKMNIYVVGAVTFVGFLGLPRWILGHFRNRRQKKFLNDFADAIDVMVRGLKAGLPVSEAMKIIASESGEPVGPEFTEVVEGQRVGISLDQGIERMVERMPLPEVNFLAIVMGIQAKTGGNLAEALGNLSRVLRDRKKMKGKIKAISQEAKSSAAIIGSLPFVMITLIWFANPEYLKPLFETTIGNICVALSIVWMSTGVLVMRWMINFEI
jgi:tight adherence protein B